ncbi:MAG: hypothetical protein M3Z57_04085 [Candidatus Dormibacteraeota bacterium]|nr:hypothetical protein [Candidatus Dormibacteraeota bacterium]
MVVVLFLFGAYRSLGGAQPKPTDSAVLLRALHGQLRTSLAALVAELDSPGERGKESDAARDGRKVSSAVQQTLDRLAPPAGLDNRDATARTLLAAAAEDSAWAWRMISAPLVSPAVTAAATALADHAAACCDQAGPLLEASALGEPSDGP